MNEPGPTFAAATALEPASLSARSIGVTLGSTVALRDVDLDLRPGWTAIVGPNGAGKSTLLRVLAGLHSPDHGHLHVHGRVLGELSARELARQIAWLAQQGDSTSELTVREVVQLGRLPWLGLFDSAGPLDESAIDAAMVATECAAWQDRRLAELSGGERQRVLVARALAVGAPILLLDEPTAHIDALHQVALLRVLRRLAGEGRTVVSALHDLTLAFAADRIVLLDRGRVRATGAPGDATLHEEMLSVFGGAIRIEASGTRWVVLPNLD